MTSTLKYLKIRSHKWADLGNSLISDKW